MLATTPISQVRGGVNAQRISAHTAGRSPRWKSLAALRAAAGRGADARAKVTTAARTCGRIATGNSTLRSPSPVRAVLSSAFRCDSSLWRRRGVASRTCALIDEGVAATSSASPVDLAGELGIGLEFQFLKDLKSRSRPWLLGKPPGDSGRHDKRRQEDRLERNHQGQGRPWARFRGTPSTPRTTRHEARRSSLIRQTTLSGRPGAAGTYRFVFWLPRGQPDGEAVRSAVNGAE